jgi:hypothetical protein
MTEPEPAAACLPRARSLPAAPRAPLAGSVRRRSPLSSCSFVCSPAACVRCLSFFLVGSRLLGTAAALLCSVLCSWLSVRRLSALPVVNTHIHHVFRSSLRCTHGHARRCVAQCHRCCQGQTHPHHTPLPLPGIPAPLAVHSTHANAQQPGYLTHAQRVNNTLVSVRMSALTSRLFCRLSVVCTCPTAAILCLSPLPLVPCCDFICLPSLLRKSRLLSSLAASPRRC